MKIMDSTKSEVLIYSKHNEKLDSKIDINVLDG
jgi:hypothetical protein